MKHNFLSLTLIALLLTSLPAAANNLTVKMDKTSPTMTMVSKATGASVTTGDPTNNIYTFECDPGDYIITGYNNKGGASGTIEVCVCDSAKQQITVLTCTTYATNKVDNKAWTVDNGDYTINPSVSSREGVNHPITLGKSTTANRYTFLALNGDSYRVELIPSDAHKAEGYMSLFLTATLTAGVTASGEIPLGTEYSVTFPADATMQIGQKVGYNHYVDFRQIEPLDPEGETVEGGLKKLTYRLAQGQVYNYRTFKAGGLTQAGYFCVHKDLAKRPTLSFKDSDYAAFPPEKINHDVNSNGGYETGDIFVNINRQGHLSLNVGDTFKAHGLRSWEITDTQTNNYFMEPDFHYTVLGVDGKPDDSVISITQNAGSPWADITAKAAGTVIVLVTYDAIGVNYYDSSSGIKHPYMGGEFWGAIWPENTAAYVVTVGQTASAVEPEMKINEKYNTGALKRAGEYVDAEHDVFYYLDTEQGFPYTFTPRNAAEVTMAYPAIGDRMATYTGFGSEGVTKNADGSYTLLLKRGRQIVRLTDAAGNACYQVLTAKPCHREITNASRPGSKFFIPGDKASIQFSGLFHPANKMAGIYNMSAYVTYNGNPNGTALILGAGQYTFGSVPSAQNVTVEIPENTDVTVTPEILMNDGVIQVNGFGDPIGNHREIDYRYGRNANFTAIAHKTYFGTIPETRIPLHAARQFDITVDYPAPDAVVTVSYNGKQVTPGTDGKYAGTYGVYTVNAYAPGYRFMRRNFTVGDDAEGTQNFTVPAVKMEVAWDGKTATEPAVNEGGAYVITTPAELRWFANKINNGKGDELKSKAVLANDIDLGDYAFTPIGGSSKPFGGVFTGAGHRIDGLYINNNASNQALFGYLKGTSVTDRAAVTGVTVSGEVTGKSQSAGIVAYLHQYADVDTCANFATINASGTGSYFGGVVGVMGHKTATVANCYNAGNVVGYNYNGGVIGNISVAGCAANVSNLFNVGEIGDGAKNSSIACCGNSVKDIDDIKNAYALKDYHIANGYTLVTAEQMASGEIAYKLGNAFGQTIGTEKYPVFGGKEVFYDEAKDTYYNKQDASDEKNYELRVLTFEDKDFKGEPNYLGETTWSSLIDEPQFGGPLLYGDNGMGVTDKAKAYRWFDSSNTMLGHYMCTENGVPGFSDNEPTWCYWSHGHAISNYGTSDVEAYGTNDSQLTVLDANATQEVTQTGHGHDGSDNFAVHFGYADNSGYGLGEEYLPSLFFTDGTARVIDHMWVAPTTYAINCYVNGNDLTAAVGDEDWVKIVAMGYNGTDKTGEAEFYLVNGPANIVKEWTKFDLSSLGEITSVKFNIKGSSDNGYGFSQPAYFAYDDVAVRFPKVPSAVENITTAPTADAVPVAYYNMQGMKSTRPWTGFNVVLLSDGTTRKLYIK